MSHVGRRLSSLDELYANEAFAACSDGCVKQSHSWESAPVVAVIFAQKCYFGLVVCEGYSLCMLLLSLAKLE